MDGHIMCGGYVTKTSCLHYVAGKWARFRRNLVNYRSYHVSWKRPDGDVVLLGKPSKNSKISDIGQKEGGGVRKESKFECKKKVTFSEGVGGP